jgi:hypothetical protein
MTSSGDIAHGLQRLHERTYCTGFDMANTADDILATVCLCIVSTLDILHFFVSYLSRKISVDVLFPSDACRVTVARFLVVSTGSALSATWSPSRCLCLCCMLTL